MPKNLRDLTKPDLSGISDLDLAAAAQARGFTVEKNEPSEQTLRVRAGRRFKGLTEYTFGVFSCAHLGSKHQQLSHLREFYRRCGDAGCEVVLNCGDTFEGDGRVYKGQEYEVHLHGADAQLEYGVAHYPREKGIRTILIAGNHDQSFYERGGFDIVKALADRRPDLKYIGAYGATVEIGPLKCYMMHGKGGGSYARSYKLQKIVEQFTPEHKPHLFFLGHFHCNAYLSMYRNVAAWQLGAFQGQTPFGKRLGLAPEVGGWIIKVHCGNSDRPGGIVRLQSEHVPFYVPKENDW